MRKVMKVLVVSVFLITLISCGSETKSENDNENVDDTETADEVEDADMEVTDEEPAYEPNITDKVLMKTSMGDITIGLYGDDTPNTVDNFKQYVTDEFFDGLIFHRVIPGFVAQGGGYDADLNPRETRDSIDFEASPKIKHVKYVVSMARSSVHSATSQFFIMLGEAPHLDFESEEDFLNPDKYPCTAFGEVTAGFNVVDAIGVVETETVIISDNSIENVPVETITIESAVLVN